MTIVHDRYVVAETPSDGWLDAVRTLQGTPNRKVVHLMVRVLDPTTERQEIRALAQGLIDDRNARGGNMPAVETTRNTIFPKAWADRLPEPRDLAAYYRARYKRGCLLSFPGNSQNSVTPSSVPFSIMPSSFCGRGSAWAKITSVSGRGS